MLALAVSIDTRVFLSPRYRSLDVADPAGHGSTTATVSPRGILFHHEGVVMKRSRTSTWFGLVGLCVVAATAAGACAAGGGSGNMGGNGGEAGSGGAGGVGGTAGNGQGGDVLITTSSSSSGTGGAGGGACDEGLPDKDNDGDGYTELEGDCNDCDKFVNPSAVEVIAEEDENGNLPEPADEDCDGTVDVLPPACDSGLALASLDPIDAAKAIGVCKFLKSAKWVLSDGSPPPVNETQKANFHLGHGIVAKLGTNNNPQEGNSMLFLSSGKARDKGDADATYRTFDKGYTSNAPFGFPKASPSCPNVITGLPHDATGLEIEVDVPSNALSVSFDFQFFSYEWPDFLCREYNDFFIAYMIPFPMGQSDGNIAFDMLGAPISVNNKFFEACGCPGNPVGPTGECVASTFPFKCSLETKQLVGTTFEKDEANAGWSHGSTGWLRTTTAVTPGSPIRLRLVTYDSTDGKVDSSTLIDNWRWSGKPGTTVTEVIIPK
ncbi:choice-of-anchor L domain-containing protein [Polyangium jinanense]|uniref:choice-of-anchor L domain-containing protein n=1 Tax=Polyangium jinanense TaxID=2829994 RepID=UPI0023401FD8|nr:choice-of-anchor L domain-containing protein [Polyangium jinanense]MDC3953825.1 choice-of-anchor L domain-containing protein [Polyangium jinanense]